MTTTSTPKFNLGQILSTPGALLSLDVLLPVYP